MKQAAKSFIDEVVPASTEASANAIKMEIWWFDGAENIKQLQGASTSSTTLKEAVDGITPEMSSDNSTNLYGAVIQGIEVASQKLTQTRESK